MIFSGCESGLHISYIEVECRQSIAGKKREFCLWHIKQENKYQRQIEYCQKILNNFKLHWHMLDKQIIEESKIKNQPLPKDFQTTEEIFKIYPNPCDPNVTKEDIHSAYWQYIRYKNNPELIEQDKQQEQQIQEFNKKQKDKQSENKT